jgi:hypothetical protein
MQFYFPLSSVVSGSSVGNVFACYANCWGPMPNELSSLTTISIKILEAVKFNYSFNSLHLFSYFVCSHLNTTKLQLVSQRKRLNSIHLQGIFRLGPRFPEETHNETQTCDEVCLYRQQLDFCRSSYSRSNV